MFNIFEEIRILKILLSEEDKSVNEKVKYLYDTLQASFQNEVDYMNANTCLEYIDYSKYTALITQNLKNILKNLQQDIVLSDNKKTALKSLLQDRLSKVIKLSILTNRELKKILEVFPDSQLKPIPKADVVSVFVEGSDCIHLSFAAKELLSMDAILFMIDYIAEKYQNETITLDMYLDVYLNQDSVLKK